jgi:3-deoxy-D-manno-octulosonic-acid transferase
MIEPAAYGAAVCFGPNTWNFRDIVASLRAARAAVVVRDPDELTRFVARCLDNPTYASRIGGRAQALVLSQIGATDRCFTLLESLLDQPAQHVGAAASSAA